MELVNFCEVFEYSLNFVYTYSDLSHMHIADAVLVELLMRKCISMFGNDMLVFNSSEAFRVIFLVLYMPF